MDNGILHKASCGYRQGWEQLETKWLELENGLAGVAKTSDHVIQEVESTAETLAGELLLGYKWLRKWI
ncbi:MAG TPA: hypothetical protein VJ725_08415 [Thermoanaerobaculia bacterium]|nr:hypothetical protein [Thermoanaerobaculia bacterium]